MVVVAGGEEGGVEADVAAVGGDAEAERVAVEGQRAVQVGDPEVHVADADGGMDGSVCIGQCPARGAARHRWFHLTGGGRGENRPW